MFSIFVLRGSADTLATALADFHQLLPHCYKFVFKEKKFSIFFILGGAGTPVVGHVAGEQQQPAQRGEEGGRGRHHLALRLQFSGEPQAQKQVMGCLHSPYILEGCRTA
jgi:hypothetical protein